MPQCQALVIIHFFQTVFYISLTLELPEVISMKLLSIISIRNLAKRS